MKKCPRCNMDKLNEIEVRNALSRRDNNTYICSDCGNEEAFIDAGMMEVNTNEVQFLQKLKETA
jgi:transcription elongation factor Elf1